MRVLAIVLGVATLATVLAAIWVPGEPTTLLEAAQ